MQSACLRSSIGLRRETLKLDQGNFLRSADDERLTAAIAANAEKMPAVEATIDDDVSVAKVDETKSFKKDKFFKDAAGSEEKTSDAPNAPTGGSAQGAPSAAPELGKQASPPTQPPLPSSVLSSAVAAGGRRSAVRIRSRRSRRSARPPAAAAAAARTWTWTPTRTRRARLLLTCGGGGGRRRSP